jgi:hypothetical protein
MFGINALGLNCLGLAFGSLATAHVTNSFVSYIAAVSPVVTFSFYTYVRDLLNCRHFAGRATLSCNLIPIIR